METTRAPIPVPGGTRTCSVSTIHSILFQKFRSLHEIWMRQRRYQMLPATQASSAWLRAITSWTDYKSPMTSLNSSVSTPVSCSPCVWPSTTTSPPRSVSRTTRHRTAVNRPPSLSADTTSEHRALKVCFSSLVLCERAFVHHLASAIQLHELQGRLSARTLRTLLQHTHQACALPASRFPERPGGSARQVSHARWQRGMHRLQR